MPFDWPLSDDMLDSQGAPIERVQSMNLAGVLSPNSWISSFLLISFLVISASAQISQKADATEQTSFSMEFPFERPVTLSEAAKKALATDRGIADVMKDDQLSIETIPKDWFTASEVHLGPKSETHLVVMGLGISLGPYSAGFWILRQTPQGYEIVMATDTHDLTLLDTSTNGLRDIETGLPTGGQRYSDIYRFDGHRYQKSSPMQESQSSKVPQPVATHVESIAYPDLARAAQIQGTVDVEIIISSDGEVSTANAISGHPVLKQAAEKNIRRWRFGPSSAGDTPLTVRYEFRLELPKTYYRPESRDIFELPTRVTVISNFSEPQP
jgi:TonB family protein